jgi:hypothetical protein
MPADTDLDPLSCRDRALAASKQPCRSWAACSCETAADGHCWLCGHLESEHREEVRHAG